MVEEDGTAASMLEVTSAAAAVADRLTNGGLPSPSTDSNSPREITVTNTSHGTETGGFPSPNHQCCSGMIDVI